MARRKEGRVRRIYVTRTRRSHGGRKRGFLHSALGKVLAGAIAFPIVGYVFSKFLPSQYLLGASLMGAGAGLYALDGKAAGEVMVGAGLGALALPYIMGATGQKMGVTFD